MAMTIEQLVEVVNVAFPGGVNEFGAALSMLNAQMDLEVANSRQRLAQVAASQANQQAQTIIQQAQADAIAAQAAFDAIVASLAGR